jgi:hypothetical protein
MKNTLHPRWIALFAWALLALSTTSCSNLFWTPDQTVPPRLKGPTALRPDLAANVASGLWYTTLHNEEGDTLNHRWEGRNLVFEKSTNQMTLLVWDQDQNLVRGHRFLLADRRFLKRTTPFSWTRRVSPGEQYAYYPIGTVGFGLIQYYSLFSGTQPPDWFIFLLPVGPVADAATGIVGEVRANKDPRLRKTLIRILPLNEDPEWLPASARADENQ